MRACIYALGCVMKPRRGFSTSVLFIQIVLDGLNRNLAKHKVRKVPVTTDMLSALVVSFSDAPFLTEVHFGGCLLPSFFGICCVMTKLLN